MQLIVRVDSFRKKYGAESRELMRAVEAVGPLCDVSRLSAPQIRTRISKLPASEAVCLIGGYDIIPAFRRKNPTSHLNGDDDGPIPTDAPYGAAPGVIEDEYAPGRAISRIPDGVNKDATSFLKLLKAQKAMPQTRTPSGCFEEAANEFSGAAGYVHKFVAARSSRPSLSPPSVAARPDPVPLLSGSGRVHILLHGANYSPDWASLFGRSESAPRDEYPVALTSALIGRCDLAGSIVTFSSCYAAMLDGRGGRTSSNQVALACLHQGAKVVIGATRSNWIETRAPYDGLAPGLVAAFWKELSAGRTAGDAFVRAKVNFVKNELSRDPSNHPYVLKTVLQMHLYGNSEARL